MRERARKRSTAITLVLAGSATLGGCGSPVEQRDAYSSMQSCVRDWSNSSLCEPVKDGKYASSYFYGPPYYAQSSGWRFFGGGSPNPSPNAMDAQRLQNGSVASSPKSQMAMRMGLGPSSRSGSSSSSSSVSRGGFGSSSHASSSSGG